MTVELLVLEWLLLFDGNSNLTHNNEKVLKEGTPMTMANL